MVKNFSHAGRPPAYGNTEPMMLEHPVNQEYYQIYNVPPTDENLMDDQGSF